MTASILTARQAAVLKHMYCYTTPCPLATAKTIADMQRMGIVASNGTQLTHSAIALCLGNAAYYQ